MSFAQLLIVALAFLAGVGLGASGYRYVLKRDPERLERWAAEVRDAKAAVGKRFE